MEVFCIVVHAAIIKNGLTGWGVMTDMYQTIIKKGKNELMLFVCAWATPDSIINNPPNNPASVRRCLVAAKNGTAA